MNKNHMQEEADRILKLIADKTTPVTVLQMALCDLYEIAYLNGRSNGYEEGYNDGARSEREYG